MNYFDDILISSHSELTISFQSKWMCIFVNINRINSSEYLVTRIMGRNCNCFIIGQIKMFEFLALRFSHSTMMTLRLKFYTKCEEQEDMHGFVRLAIITCKFIKINCVCLCCVGATKQ